MPNPKGPPSTKPFRRTSGYRSCWCPHCGEHSRQRQGGNATARPDTGKVTCYLRALVSPEDKQYIIDESRRQGLSISALVRRMILGYRSSHD